LIKSKRIDMGVNFITTLKQRVPLVEDELITLPEHLCLLPVFSEFMLLDL